MRAVSLIALLLGAGCGGDDAGDGRGDDCPAFTNVVGGTFDRAVNALTFTLEVEAMPAEFTFDQAEVPNFVAEYVWAAEVDVDGDDMHDWEISAKHYKMDGPERVLAAPLEGTQNALWRVMGPAGTLVGSMTATLAGSTFTFVVDADEDSMLSEVTADSAVTYTTYYHHGSRITDQCTDSF